MLSKFSVKKPYTIIVFIIIIAILGGVAYFNMSVDLLPNLELPYIAIVVVAPGSSPEDVERSICSPVEQAMSTIDNVKTISSSSNEHYGLILMEFNGKVDLVAAMLDIQSVMVRLKSSFPALAMEPMILKLDPTMLPVMNIAISKKGSTINDSSLYLESVGNQLLSVEGVASVSFEGLVDNMVLVMLNSDKLKASLLSTIAPSRDDYPNDELYEAALTALSAMTDLIADMIGSMLQPELIGMALFAQNLNMPSGSVKVDGVNYLVKIGDNIKSFEELQSTPIMSVNFQQMMSGYQFLIDAASSIEFTEESIETVKEYLLTQFEGDETLTVLINMFFNTENLDNSPLFINNGDGTYSINGEAFNLLANLPALTLRVNDLAEVVELNTAGNEFSLVNGAPGVMLSIQKQSGYSTVEVSKGVRDRLAEIGAKDSDFEYIMLLDQGEYIEFMINSIIKNLLLGALFAILVLYAFLRRIKPTLIVGSSIILSVVAALVMMYFAGINLNLLSMGGLALGVGMLVDNSIVVIENIYRKRSEGESVYSACVEGAKQVSGAIVASTLTTVIIFLPVLFLEGLTMQIFKDLAFTIAFSLAASLIVALTFVPMASSAVLKREDVGRGSRFFDILKDKYARSMQYFLKRRWMIIVLVLVLFSSSIISVFNMNRVFFPESDMGYITINAEVVSENLPEDISYNEALELIIVHLDGVISEEEYIKDAGIQVTTGMEMFGISFGEMRIQANIVLSDDKKRPSANTIIENILYKCKVIAGLEDYEDAYIIKGSSESMDMGMLSDDALTFNIYGDQLDEVRQVSRELAELFKNVEGVNPEKIDDGVGEPPLEYRLIVDKDKASINGFLVGQVLQIMQTILASPTSSSTVRFDSTRLYYDVYVYGNEYNLTRWYKTVDKDGKNVKVFVNYDNTYHILIDGNIVPAVRVEENSVPINKFKYSEGSKEYYLEGLGENMTVYYSLEREAIDLMELMITNENGDSVKLYKILSDESFVQDEYGNVVYRLKKGLDGNPIPVMDGFDPVRDEHGNIVYEYELDEEGNKIPLAIDMKEGYHNIRHENGIRRTTLSVGLMSGSNTDKVLSELRKIINSYDAPQGVIIEVQGENQMVIDAYQTLLVVLILGVVLIYLVMVAQFQSLKSPMIIMFTVPLAFTGSVFAILMTGNPISIVALMGLVILMGVVVNNGIVFVDYVNKLLESGMDRKEALIKAGRDRIRPIMMTALTTIFALSIMAFDTSPEGSMMRPMAISTIGGMVYATGLTVYFVPIMYDIFNKKKGNVIKTMAAGQVYTASLTFVPYSEIEKYKDEEPYDRMLLKKRVHTKALTKANALELYRNTLNRKNDSNE